MKATQAKGRGKRKNGKLEKVEISSGNTNTTINLDLSSLHKPIDTSLSSLYQISKLLENGTDEVKSILSYECDIVYECRICRSLFRSIINLISHKREYCREKFNMTLRRGIRNDYNAISGSKDKGSVIHMCKTGQTEIIKNVKNDRILRSQVPKEPHKKDLSTIVDMLNKKREKKIENGSLNKSKSTISDVLNEEHIYLEPINTNCSAVYQTVKSFDSVVDTTELMKEQVAELQKITDQRIVTLDETMFESHLEKSDSPIQIDVSDEENELLIDRLSVNNLVCPICNAKFSTKKTLTFHMKTLHTSQRMCYPCPCCTSTFANAWSVYRHLFKVHRKTNKQVRKLRSHIQKEAFQKETTASGDLEKGHATNVFTSENVTWKKNNKTQEYINYLKSDIQPKSCGCGKQFDRKAALSAHLQYCQRQIAGFDKFTAKIRQPNKILSDSIPSDICEIENVRIVDDTILKKSAKENLLDMSSRCISSYPEICNPREVSVQNVSSLSKENWDILKNDRDYREYNSVDNNNDLPMITSSTSQNINDSESLSFDENSHFKSDVWSPEITRKSTGGVNSIALKVESRKREVSGRRCEEQRTDLEVSGKDIEMREDIPRSELSIQPNETDQTLIMENKIAAIINLRKLQCLLCKRKFTSTTNLRRHMAIHIGWNRYRCKLCDFKCFVKCDCVAHCNKMHDAQNDRAIIADMVVQISQNEYIFNEDIVMDVNTEKTTVDPDIIDRPASSYQSEIDLNNLDHTNVYMTSHNEANTRQITESYRNIEDETTKIQNAVEYMMNWGSEKLDAHPDLKRIVMEVIFGPSDMNVTKQTDKSALDDSNDVGKDMNIDNENNIASSDECKEAPALISDNSKPQRPMRNRIKHLNEDFVYDLKEATYRKECSLFKGQFHLDKSLTKRSSAFI